MVYLNENKEKLKNILTEMFQFEQADLDFGIYRIMNQKRSQIEHFMNNELFEKIDEAIAPLKSSAYKENEIEIKKKINTLNEVNEDGSLDDKILTLEEELASYSALDTDKIESEIYSYLTEFFRRYYDEGDFISQRRYKDGVYAIPYEGEEVKLHWANCDQYYIKSSEYFNDYIFEDSHRQKVHFKLLDAKTDKDNNKGDKRTFQIIKDINKFNENMDEKDKLNANPEIIDDVLVIYFVYTEDETNQKKRNEEAYEYLVNKFNENKWTNYAVLVDKRRKKDKSELEKQLLRYTARNTYDYFIHKDLKAFLTRELDFYIKNEILHIEDMNPENLLKVQEYLIKVKTVENIANVVIDFLVQIEEFQKTLWLKKKFVTCTNYCITLDKINEKFYVDIINNEKQIDEWKKMFAIDELPGFSGKLNKVFLEENPYLLVDTKFFDYEFKEELIESIENLDEQVNGLLINADNFHALNLLQEKYENKIDCVYIDPPYNTDSSPIMYKNNYKDSSWLSLMYDRNLLSLQLANQNALFINTIDEAEYQNLIHLNNQVYGKDNYIGTITVKCNPQGRVSNKVNQTSEFNIIFAKDIDEIGTLYVDKIDNYTEKTPFKRTGTNSRREERPLRFYPMLIKNDKVFMIEDDEYFNIYKKNNDFDDNYVKQLKKKYESKGYKFILPQKEDGTFLVWQREFVRAKKEFETYIVSSDSIYTPGFTKEIPKTLWESAKFANPEYGTEYVKHVLMNTAKNDVSKNTPKSFYTVEQMINLNESSLILDYFAGSGTTAHAVINLNREDDGDRKYILVEMGEYFNTVTKPRVEKVIYSKDWKNGKPVDRDGVSQIIKYITLESYEDALNNIKFKDNEMISLFDDPSITKEYMLSYMLSKETEDSMCMLNIDALSHPFEYKMKIEENFEIINKAVDIVESFNYLIGIKVRHNCAVENYDADFSKGDYGKEKAELKSGNKYKFKRIDGVLPNGKKALIIWRNLTDDIKKDNIVLNEYLNKKQIKSTNSSYDVIYVNGDNFIKNLSPDGDLKVKLIEEEMKNKMFEGVK
ncbi:MAG: DNA methyltransferase [Christensenellales bacterium]